MLDLLNIPYEFIIKCLLVLFLGGLIGYEREKIHRPAGLRTHLLVGLGALIMSQASMNMFPEDPARIIAGIVTGIGFLGAGTIFREQDIVRGLTTAASLWATSGVAIALAIGEYFVGIFGGLLIYGVLQMKHYKLFHKLFHESEKAYQKVPALASPIELETARKKRKKRAKKKE
jgi:putative Mg2+ transporter-C (MgtC) family protein